MSNANIKKCKQDTCHIHSDGKCLEGLEPEECPHFYWDSSEETHLDEETEPTNTKDVPLTSVKLFSGNELDINNITLVTQKFKTNLVVIIGESDCGKTTILATLFDLFQIGPLGRFIYGGSLTQRGFEIRCHMSRLPSNAIEPTTDRTISKDFKFLHLALKGDTPFLKHLLLSDISGEKIRLARDSSRSMEELEIINTAQNIVFIIDGEKLLELATRALTISNAKQFIQRALDTGVFNKKTRLKIVISKWDLVHNIVIDIDGLIKQPLINSFEGRLGSMKFAEIASRPQVRTPQVYWGYGLEELLTEWTDDIEQQEIEVNQSETYLSGNSYFQFYSTGHGNGK